MSFVVWAPPIKNPGYAYVRVNGQNLKSLQHLGDFPPRPSNQVQHLQAAVFPIALPDELSGDLFLEITLQYSRSLFANMLYLYSSYQILTKNIRFAPENKLHQISIKNIRSVVKASTLTYH